MKRFREIIALCALILFTNLRAPGPALGQNGDDLSAQLRSEIRAGAAAGAATEPGTDLRSHAEVPDTGTTETRTVLTRTESARTESARTESARTESARTDTRTDTRTDAGTDTRSAAAPECILLMRHAEKPEDDHITDLSVAGFKRAENLAKYILSQYGRPDYIFASANSKKSSRPYETALPLSRVSGVPIDLSYKDKDYERLAEMLRHDTRFVGKLIVVVWHHGNIPDFAEALHARDGDYPEDWNSKVYNQFLQFDYFGKSRPKVQCLTEPF